MAIYNKRIKFTREDLLNHYLNRNSVFDFIYGLVRIFGIIIENIYCVSSYLVLSWIVLLPLSWIKIELYSKAENFLYNSLLFIVSSWSLAAGLTVVETGDEFKQLIEDPHNIEHFLIKNTYETPNKTATDIQNSGANINGNNNNLNSNNNNNNLAKLSLNNKTSINQNSNGLNYRLNPCDYSTLKDESDGIHVNKNLLDPANSENHERSSGDGDDEDDQIKLEQSENDLNIIRTENSGGSDRSKSSSPLNHNNNDSNFARKSPDSELPSISSNNTSMKLDGEEKLISQQDHNDANGNVMMTNNCSSNKINSIFNSNQPALVHNKTPKVLLLCNHISTADVPLMMQSFSTLTNQSLLWVLDAQFKPTNFGLVCSSHSDFFIAKDTFKDGSLRDQALEHPDRNLFVLFPEGGFWRKRLEGSNRYALKNNLPMTKYVTHPRFGAFKDLIDPSVGITHIVDATLFYDDIRNPLSILDIVLGNRKEPAIIHYKVYNRSEINPTEEWLRNIWLEKDKLCQQYYEDRSSIYKLFEGTMRAAKLDWFKLFAVHLFYLLICYLTIYRLFNATSVTMLKARDLYYSNI